MTAWVGYLSANWSIEDNMKEIPSLGIFVIVLLGFVNSWRC